MYCVSLGLSGINECQGLFDGPTWFIRFGILLEPGDKLIKLLLSFLSALQASLQELGVVP